MLSILRLVLAIGLMLASITTVHGGQQPDVEKNIEVLRGYPIGVSVANAPHRQNLGEIQKQVRLQIHTVQSYGTKIKDFVHREQPSYAINNLYTSWDPDLLLESQKGDWCKRLNEMMPNDIRMGAHCMVVAQWRDNGGREIVEFVPYNKDTERKIITQYATHIRQRELRLAGMTTRVSETRCHLLKNELQKIQAMLKNMLEDQKETEPLSKTFREQQQNAERELQLAERRAEQWIKHLRDRLSEIDKENKDERKHVKQLIQIASDKLDALKSLVNEILELEDPTESA